MKWIPVRFQIALVALFGCFLSLMLRVDISIYLLDMVDVDVKKIIQETYCRNASAESHGGTVNRTEPAKGLPFGKLEPFYWDKYVLARIRSAYFWGYMIMNFVGGSLSEKFGPRKVLVIGFMISSIFTCLFPIGAYIHWTVVYLIRLVIGLGSGSTFPALQVVVSHWAPPREKGKFTIAFVGGNLGSVLSFYLIGAICYKTNWAIATFSSAILSGFGTFIVFFVLRNWPEEHPRISPEELEYIKTAIGEGTTKKQKRKAVPPYLKIFMSVAFWAQMCSHVGSVSQLFFFLTSLPQYIKDVLGYNLKSNAFLSALPHLCRFLAGIGFSFVGDYTRKNLEHRFSKTIQTKFYTLFSHIIPGICLICQSFTKCSIHFAMFFTSCALGFNGAAVMTTMMIPQDIAPNFAGTLFGMVNCVGSLFGVLVGELVGVLTEGKKGEELMLAWRIIFQAGGAVTLTLGLMYEIFGSAKVQSFNEIKATEEENKES